MADQGSSSPNPESDTGAYRVLARKYRPQIFSDLIGQDAMVQTLANAFKTGRIAQAYMLTGVRGVGKTTTARLIARALNYSLADGPSIDMPELGDHCQAILESNHIDVIEMDAASNTGIDDVREIIEAVRYKPVSARYKVYIIDEVHMLSRQAFNGLLKTLEEPPEHVKFIFATTEIRKVPVTVLSRCQRFDLRRIDAELLIEHFQKIADAEGATIAKEALALIARASEGSVRDGLSLLDQSFTHGASDIGPEQIQAMLGLVDRAQVIDLFEDVVTGEAGRALERFAAIYQAGGDPLTILSDLAEFVHLVTRFKVSKKAAADLSLSQSEKTSAADWAEKLDMRVLARSWQLLLKGLSEVQQATNARAAGDMVLVRLAYVSDLPTPEEIISNAGTGTRPTSSPGTTPGAPPSPVSDLSPPPLTSEASPHTHGDTPPSMTQHAAQTAPSLAHDIAGGEPASSSVMPLNSFGDVLALLSEKRDIKLKSALEYGAHLVAFGPGKIELRLDDAASGNLANQLGRKLSEWTGERWIVALSREQGEETIAAQSSKAQNLRLEQAMRDPLVKSALESFPNAEIVDVRDIFANVEDTDPEQDNDD